MAQPQDLINLPENTTPADSNQISIQNSSGKWYRIDFSTITSFFSDFFVSKTDPQSVSGQKDFTDNVTVIPPIGGTNPETKARLDAVKGAGYDADPVTLVELKQATTIDNQSINRNDDEELRVSDGFEGKYYLYNPSQYATPTELKNALESLASTGGRSIVINDIIDGGGLNWDFASSPNTTLDISNSGSIDNVTIIGSDAKIIDNAKSSGIGGNVTFSGTYEIYRINKEDGEDIKLESSKLKFNDRTYDSPDHSGNGYVILRKNIVGSDNVLVQSAFRDELNAYLLNTVFEVRYDFKITSNLFIGDGCILLFKGGSITSDNGSIITGGSGGKYSIIGGNGYCPVSTKHTSKAYTGFYNVLDLGLKNDGVTDNSPILQEIVGANATIPKESVLYFPSGDYIFTETTYIYVNYLTIMGESIGYETSNLSVGDYVTTDDAVGATRLLLYPTITGQYLFRPASSLVSTSYRNFSAISNKFYSYTTEDEPGFTTYANGPATGPIHRRSYIKDPITSNGVVVNTPRAAIMDCSFYGFSGSAIFYGGSTAKCSRVRITNCDTAIKGYNLYTDVWGYDNLFENMYISECRIGIQAQGYVFLYSSWIDEISEYAILSAGVLYLEAVGLHANHIDYAFAKAETLRDTQIEGTLNRCGCYYGGYQLSEIIPSEYPKACILYSTNPMDNVQINLKHTNSKVGDSTAVQGGTTPVVDIVAPSITESQVSVVGENNEGTVFELTSTGSDNTILTKYADVKRIMADVWYTAVWEV